MINLTGENLNILLCCKHSFLHEWMTFLSYYSIHRYLPDAKVQIICERKNLYYDLFNWTKRSQVNFEYIKPKSKIEYLHHFISKKKLQTPCLIIEPHILCVREWTDDFIPDYKKNYQMNDFFYVADPNAYDFEPANLYYSIKDNKICNFVTYSEGWGTFNMTTWINKNDYPFHPLYKFDRATLSLNEKRMDELWDSVINLFPIMFRG